MRTNSTRWRILALDLIVPDRYESVTVAAA
jgi:hypothetical protein